MHHRRLEMEKVDKFQRFMDDAFRLYKANERIPKVEIPDDRRRLKLFSLQRAAAALIASHIPSGEILKHSFSRRSLEPSKDSYWTHR